MSDRVRESISAVMDGEAEDLELRRLLAEADRPEVRKAWRDFHIQSDAGAGRDMRFADVDLSRGVWAAISKETVAPAAEARAPGSSRWMRPLVSFAVAASVAAVVVVGVRGIGGPETAVPGLADVRPMAEEKVAITPPAENAGQVPVTAEGSLPAVGAATAVTVSAGDEMTERYIERRTERAAVGEAQGVMDSARMPQQDVD